MRASPSFRPGIVLAILAGLFAILILPATSAMATSNPFTVTTLRINGGELITRSRTVTLTIDVSSSLGSITSMQLGDSAGAAWGPSQPYKKSVTYTFPGTATGRQFIAALFTDSKGNVSNQMNVFIHLIPDLPVFPALTQGTSPTLSLRRGNYSWTQLAPGVNDTGDPILYFSTSTGDLLMQLYPTKAPLTVTNFLRYVNSNEYDYSFFHRSVPGFIIQTGGYFVDTNNGNSISQIASFGTVNNEPGDSNTRGTIAMAKVDGDPNSATSEWFVNLDDNSANLDSQNGGFTVFGKILESTMPVVDGIGELPVSDQSATIGFDALPLIKVPGAGESLQLDDLVLTYTASRFTFSIVKQVPGVKASIINNLILVEPSGRPTSGQSSILVHAVAQDGRTLDFPVLVDVATNHPMLENGAGSKKVNATEDTPVDIPIRVNNPDNSTLTWTISPPAKGACTLLSESESKPGFRSIRYTPQANASGTDSFILYVKDDDVDPQKVGRDSVTVNITIKPVNDLPTITAPATFVMKGGTPATFDITVADVETPAADLLVTCAAKGGSVLPKGTVTVDGTGATRTVHLAPTVTLVDVPVALTLTVTDGDKKRGTARVAMTVTP